MARPIARDAEDFARLMLQMLEQQGAEWLAGARAVRAGRRPPSRAPLPRPRRGAAGPPQRAQRDARGAVRGRVPPPRAAQGRRPAQRRDALPRRATGRGGRAAGARQPRPAAPLRDAGEPSAARRAPRRRGARRAAGLGAAQRADRELAAGRPGAAACCRSRSRRRGAASSRPGIRSGNAGSGCAPRSPASRPASAAAEHPSARRSYLATRGSRPRAQTRRESRGRQGWS